jgi:hypothetical protein
MDEWHLSLSLSPSKSGLPLCVLETLTMMVGICKVSLHRIDHVSASAMAPVSSMTYDWQACNATHVLSFVNE